MSKEKKGFVKLRFANRLFKSAKEVKDAQSQISNKITTFNELLTVMNLDSSHPDFNDNFAKAYFFNAVSYYFMLIVATSLIYYSTTLSTFLNITSVVLLSLLALISALPHLKVCVQLKNRIIINNITSLIQLKNVLIPLSCRDHHGSR